MAENTLRIYLAALVMQLGLALMALGRITLAGRGNPVDMKYVYGIGLLSALVAGLLLLWYLIASFLATSEQS
jgi:hypothetical protein